MTEQLSLNDVINILSIVAMMSFSIFLVIITPIFFSRLIIKAIRIARIIGTYKEVKRQENRNVKKLGRMLKSIENQMNDNKHFTSLVFDDNSGRIVKTSRIGVFEFNKIPEKFNGFYINGNITDAFQFISNINFVKGT